MGIDQGIDQSRAKGNASPPTEASSPATIPDCRRCRHFFITHDPGRPMGCRAYGFKCQAQPSRLVLTTSGLACQFFAPRPGR